MGLHIIFIILYFGLANVFSAETLCGLMMAHCCIGVLINLFSTQKPSHFLTAFYAGVFIATTANLFFIIKVRTIGIEPNTMYFYIIPAYIDEAVTLWCVGNSFIFLGYMMFGKSSLPSLRVDLTTRKALSSLFTFAVVSGVLTLTGNSINLGFISGGLGKVLSLLGLGGIVFYSRLWARTNDQEFKRYALSLWALHTLIALFVSFLRADLLTPSFGAYVGYFMGKGSAKYLFSYRILPGLIALFIFAQFFQSLGGHRSNFINTFTAPEYSSNESYKIEGKKNNESGGAFERSSNIAQLTNVVALTKKHGFYNGEASLPLVAAVIPRVLWPDKPKVQLGAWFALEIGAATLTDEGRANNSINMTMPGQLFLDFGWIGISVGSMLFGWMLALFWNAAEFNSSAFNITGTLWGSYLLLYAIIGMGADLQIIISLFSTYFVLLIIKKISANSANNSRRPALAGK